MENGTKSKAIVVLSGGQDSTTCLFWAKTRFFNEIHCITFDYGQRHRIEIDAAKKVAELAKVDSHEIIQVPNCLVSSSPLTSNNELEKYNSYAEMDAAIGDRRELTFVPMRNALFLTIAANRAEAIGAKDIVTGVCQEDNANYDDCRGVFLSATEIYINRALGHDHRDTGTISIHAPLLFMSKAQSVLLARSLGPDCWNALSFSHTSYDGKYPPTDNNHSNVLRAQGFLEAGLPDPLVLRAVNEGLMVLPNTSNYEEWAIRTGYNLG